MENVNDRRQLVNSLCTKIAQDGVTESELLEKLNKLKRSEVENWINEEVKGTTSLCLAVQNCFPEVVEKLFSLGANVKLLTSSEGLTPFHYITKINPDQLNAEKINKIIALLCGIGGNIDSQATDGCTALHLSINSLLLTQALIKNNANVNCFNFNKETPLHLACKSENPNSTVIEFLVLKADLKVVDDLGNTPLHCACQNYHLNILVIQLLTINLNSLVEESKLSELRKAKSTAQVLNSENYKSETPLLCTLRYPHILSDSNTTQRATSMLLLNADPQVPNSEGETPLHFACRLGKPAENEVRSLLANGASPNIANKQNKTAIHSLCESPEPSTNILQLLLQYGAKKDKKTHNGDSVLHLASENLKCNQRFINELIEKFHSSVKDFVDQKNILGESALFRAVKQNHNNAIRVLLQKNADFQIKCNKGNTVLHLCAETNNCEALELILRKAGAEKNGREKLQESLEISNSSSWTALHVASFWGHVEAATLLIKYGANPNFAELSHQTSLQVAANNKRIILVQTYLDHICKSLPLDSLDRMFSETKLACEVGCLDYIKMRLGDDRILDYRGAVNKYLLQPKDKDGECLLKMAIDHRQKAIANVIIESKLWELSLKNKWLETDNKRHECRERRVTPMRLLIQEFPELAMKVLDKCITRTTEHQLRFNYEFIEDSYWSKKGVETGKEIKDGSVLSQPINPDNNGVEKGESNENPLKSCDIWSRKNRSQETQQTNPNNHEIEMGEFNKDGPLLYQPTTPDNEGVERGESNEKLSRKNSSRETDNIIDNHPLMIMVRLQQNELLNHPLVESFVSRKWSFFRYIYYIALAWNFILLISLTGYVLYTPAPIDYRSCNMSNFTPNSDYTLSKYFQVFTIIDLSFFTIVLGFAICGSFIRIKVNNTKYSYIRAFWYLSYLLILLMTWCLPLSRSFSLHSFTETEFEEKGMWLWIVGITAVSIHWLTLIIQLMKYPVVGIQIIAFFKVFKTFASYFPMLIIFLGGFSLVFFAFLQNTPQYNYFWIILLRKAVMIIGEYSTLDRLLQIDESKEECSILPQPLYSYIGIFDFLLFLAIMTVIVSMMVALATEDISKHLNEAKAVKLAIRTRMVISSETTFLRNLFWHKVLIKFAKFMQYDFFKDHEIIRPDKNWRYWQKQKKQTRRLDKEIQKRAEEIARAQENDQAIEKTHC